MSLYESESGQASVEGSPGGTAARRARAQTFFEQGQRLLNRGDNAGAKEALTQALLLAPGSSRVAGFLALACTRLGDKVEAERHARATLELDPQNALMAHLLGTLLVERDQLVEAVAWLTFAADRLPDMGQVVRDLAATQLFVGDVEGARRNMLRALELDPLAPEASFAAARLVNAADDGEDAQRLMAVLDALQAREDLQVERRIEVCYALGRAHEDRKDFDRAFQAYAEGARLKRAGLDYSIEDLEAHAQRIIEMFSSERIRAMQGAGLKARRRPVFVVGMPRSGTTLVEQILGAHTDVQCAGENPALINTVVMTKGKQGGARFPDWVTELRPGDCERLGVTYMQALPPPQLGRTVVTDKRLENVLYLGLAHLCLEDARIVHVRRDPRDTALACFTMLFSEGQEYSYDFAELARYQQLYERMIAHWREALPPGRLLEIDYEALVADPETHARRLLEHVGLEWDEACLHPHEARKMVRSASAAQVREPIHARGVGRWRPFAEHLKPAFEALGLEA
ncbi:MAG: sulfotransferase [Proteobacteria bacterium]|nr:sulfotransferase [Pseudomonadota bacterium]